jgi:hypothetical protein
MGNRSVVEIMVLCFTLIVTVAICGLGAAIVVVEVRDPTADTALLANTLMSLVSGILGALLGLIAGRSTSSDQLERRPKDEDD